MVFVFRVESGPLRFLQALSLIISCPSYTPYVGIFP